MLQDRAQVDIIDLSGNGGILAGGGGMVRRLMACRDGHGGIHPHKLRTMDMVLNDMMPIEAWKQLDDLIIQEVQLRLVGVADLLSRGLERNLRSVGMGKTVLEWQDQSDIGPAEITMDAVADATRDKSLFNFNLLPLFITHKDVSFTLREMEEARQGGFNIDTSNLALAARKVAEGIEDLLFNGPSQAISLPTVWGNALAYGYRTVPSRNTGSLTASWATATPLQIKNDLIAMKAAAVTQRMYGPYMLYVPTGYEQKLDDDYVTTTATITTIRERLLGLGNLVGIRVADFLPADNVLLVQMTREVVDMVVALDPMIVPWEEKGGLRQNFKIMTIMVPRLKATYAARTGIIHRTFP